MRPLADEQRAGLLSTLADHVREKQEHIGCEPPSPKGCAVLLALDVLGAAVALGPFEIPELGIKVFDCEGPKR